MIYEIRNGNLIATAETPAEAEELGQAVKSIGTREQIALSLEQATTALNEWTRLLAEYDSLAG